MQKLFKALSSETRLKIVEFLLETKACRYLSDIAKVINRDESTVCRHLKVLQEANIVEIRGIGPFREICIKDPEDVKELLECAKRILSKR